MKTFQPIEDQIAVYCNADDNAKTCPCCDEILDEMYDGNRWFMYCGYCECEVESEEEY